MRRLWDSNPYQTDRQPAILTIKLNRTNLLKQFIINISNWWGAKELNQYIQDYEPL